MGRLVTTATTRDDGNTLFFSWVPVAAKDDLDVLSGVGSVSVWSVCVLVVLVLYRYVLGIHRVESAAGSPSKTLQSSQ